MRLRETEYHVHEDDDLQDSIDQWMEEDGVHEVRIEIHSLDDPPWPTERPERWGVGHLCEVQRSPENVYRGICVVDDSDEYATVLVPSEASVWEFPLDQITGYGPRAEVQ